ncbi:MAG TPA: hypothetical protein ENN19_15040 [Chloroflexi bacterium]|nr:hypothetical protein [Chloroflexota bacterium]
MGKLFISPSAAAQTPLDRVRQPLEQAEGLLSSLQGVEDGALRLLHLLDQVDEAIGELESAGADVRAEKARFESVQDRLRQRQAQFVRQVGRTLQEERAVVQSDRLRWWWFLDESVALQRRERIRRLLLGGLALVFLCAATWFLYERYLAPPPDLRHAWQHSDVGERLAKGGDWQGGLLEFEKASAYVPNEATFWVWQGVLHAKLDQKAEAEKAFDVARALYDEPLDFLLQRAVSYMAAGDLAAANADVEAAISEHPHSGRSYYIRANIALEENRYLAALADLDEAARLAREAGDSELEAAARVQKALVFQFLPEGTATPDLDKP